MAPEGKTFDIDLPAAEQDDERASDHEHPIGPQAPPVPAHEHEIPEELPLLLTGEAVMFPALVVPITVLPDSPGARALDAAAGAHEKLIVLAAQQHGEDEEAKAAPPYGVGVVSRIVRLAKAPGGPMQAVLQGVIRARLDVIGSGDPYPRAAVSALEDDLGGANLEALQREVLNSFRELVTGSEQLPDELAAAAANIDSPAEFGDFVAANSPTKPEDRQEILETLDVAERLRKELTLLLREVEVVRVGAEIREAVQKETEKRQREFILREQLKAIQRELGEGADGEDLSALRERLAAADLPDPIRREADRELDRLSTINAISPEYHTTRTYLEWIADLPWRKSSQDRLDIAAARTVLDQDHFDLDKVKERILDYLAVRKLRADTRGPILCFVGPPGVGKTSLGQSIARALGREFLRLSLGGLRDEASIRGFRRTYVGALPGRILQEIKRAGTDNPVFMLDEVDKIGSDFRGDPASALLEVLDPAQNHAFVDHYLDLPFDLSRVLFICTANQTDTIPPPLLDRMELIEIPSYTAREKVEIARRYLVPRQITENGLPDGVLTIRDDTLAALIDGYTREAGVRQLERQVGALARWVARRVAVGETDPVTVTPDQLEPILGPRKFREDLAEEHDEVGVATGLAATIFGGDVLYVEAAMLPGAGKLTLTGQLGEVMRESATAALTYARGRSDALGLAAGYFDKHDLHVHVPAGGIPKEGPSAGITMATAIISAATGRKVRKRVAMTGEITLHGRVLPIGGLKEKTLAAHRLGIREIIVPKANEPDWQEVPEEVRDEMNLHLVKSLDQVQECALHARKEEPAARVGVPAGGL